jgi:hypothetical protein
MSSFTTTVSNGVVVTTVPIGPGAIVGDLLEWNGTAWVPTSTFNVSKATAGILTFIRPTNPLTQYVDIQTGLIINSPPSVAFVPGFNSQSVVRSDAPEFVGPHQSNIRALNQAGMNPAAVGFEFSSNFRSEFSAVGPIQDYNPPEGAAATVDPDNPNVPFAMTNSPEQLFHFIGVTGILGSSVLRWGATVSGLTYANSYNILSGKDAKKDIEEKEIDSHVLRDLKTVQFRYKEEHPNAPKSFGFIAEEVDKVFPGTMAGDLQAKQDASKPAMGHYLNLNHLIGYLAGALKHLEERVSFLERENLSLRARVESIESHV